MSIVGSPVHTDRTYLVKALTAIEDVLARVLQARRVDIQEGETAKSFDGLLALLQDMLEERPFKASHISNSKNSMNESMGYKFRRPVWDAIDSVLLDRCSPLLDTRERRIHYLCDLLKYIDFCQALLVAEKAHRETYQRLCVKYSQNFNKSPSYFRNFELGRDEMPSIFLITVLADIKDGLHILIKKDSAVR